MFCWRLYAENLSELLWYYNYVRKPNKTGKNNHSEKGMKQIEPYDVMVNLNHVGMKQSSTMIMANLNHVLL